MNKQSEALQAFERLCKNAMPLKTSLTYEDINLVKKVLEESVVLEALREEVVVKRYEDVGGYNQFRGDELCLTFHNGDFQLEVKGLCGSLPIAEYGKTWALTEEELL